MNKASLYFTNVGTYLSFSADNYKLYILDTFLSTESKGIYKWLNDPNSTSKIGSDLTELEKIGDNVIMWLNLDWKLYENDPEEYSLNISINKLIKIVDDWCNVIKSEPKYIIIIEKNNEYEVIGSDNPHRPAKNLADYENKLKVTMELNSNNLYSIFIRKEYKFGILAQFLIEDASEQGSFEKWAKYSSDKIVSNNGTVLTKINNNVLLYLNLDMQNYKIDPENYSLTIEKDQFIYILEKWHRLLLRQMHLILIKEDAGRYMIIASKPERPEYDYEDDDEDYGDLQ